MMRSIKRRRLQAEATLLTAKSDQSFLVAGLAANPEEAMFKPSSFQVRVKFFGYVCRQVFTMAGQPGLKRRPALLNGLAE